MTAQLHCRNELLRSTRNLKAKAGEEKKSNSKRKIKKAGMVWEDGERRQTQNE